MGLKDNAMMKIKSVSKILILLALSQVFLACANDSAKPKVENKSATNTNVATVNNNVPEGKIKITLMNVDHGDAILLQTNKKNYLIDSGQDASRNAYANNMAKLGADRVDTMIITHHHRDHMGNAKWSAGKYSVHRIWDTGIVNSTYKASIKMNELLSKGNYNNKVLKAGDTFNLDGMHFEVLSPGSFLPKFQEKEINNQSLVMKLTFGNFSMLFTGDIEAPAEEILANTYGDKLKVDIVKVPHHGSKTSSTPSFVATTNPKYALISCGEPEKTHHPNKKVVNTWKNQGAKVFNTMDNGNLTVLSDGKDFSVSMEK